jgi:hypothetical protein
MKTLLDTISQHQTNLWARLHPRTLKPWERAIVATRLASPRPAARYYTYTQFLAHELEPKEAL